MKLVKIVAIVAAVIVALGMLFESAIGYLQPQGDSTAVLRTFDANGQAHERVLSLHEDNGQLWVESGHWFRGWYNRLLENPEVELIRGDDVRTFTAHPVNTPEAVELLTGKMQRQGGRAYWVVRLLCLFAPIKPVRLDLPADAGAPAGGLG